MYFLSTEETRWVLRHLIPKARETGVVEELRGWRWYDGPLRPPYDVRLALFEVASKYCSSARDLYLRKVRKVVAPPSAAMVAGAAYHGMIAKVIQEAKRLLYQSEDYDSDALVEALRRLSVPETGLEQLAENYRQAIVQAAARIRDFEAGRIGARIQDVLSRHPHIAADSLVGSAIPVTCEHRLDGSYLGLSASLSCDASFLGGVVVFDLKFGQKRDFHRLSATGYALVMESLWEYPVDVGCTVYIDLRGKVPSVTRDIYLIDDELRQWFVDERDEKMRMVYEEIDPGVAADCSYSCPFRKECGQQVAANILVGN